MTEQPPILIATDVAERLEAVLESAGPEFAPVGARLEQALARAELCAPADMPADVVTMHSQVTFTDEHTGATHQARLVYPREAAARPGDISSCRRRGRRCGAFDRAVDRLAFTGGAGDAVQGGGRGVGALHLK